MQVQLNRDLKLILLDLIKLVKIEINFDNCTGCGSCIDACPVEVFELDEKISKTKIVALAECLDCKACEVQCPEECIEVISED